MLRRRRRLTPLLALVLVMPLACGDGTTDDASESAPGSQEDPLPSAVPSLQNGEVVDGEVVDAPIIDEDDVVKEELIVAEPDVTSAPEVSAVPPTPTRAAPPPQTTEDQGAAPLRRVLVIGDSSAAGIRWTPGAEQALQGAEFTLDLESCRRLVAPSCRGREGHHPATALDVLQWYAGTGHDTLVIAAGYNDLNHDFETAFDRIVTTATEQGIDTILWTTYREDVGYELPTAAATSYAAMNEMLAAWAASGEYPQLHLLDWWGYTAHADHWLVSDGVHSTEAGSYGFADLISRALAAIDGRPCPEPWSPGGSVEHPCPMPYGLPDERGGTPPVTDLYP